MSRQRKGSWQARTLTLTITLTPRGLIGKKKELELGKEVRGKQIQSGRGHSLRIEGFARTNKAQCTSPAISAKGSDQISPPPSSLSGIRHESTVCRHPTQNINNDRPPKLFASNNGSGHLEGIYYAYVRLALESCFSGGEAKKLHPPTFSSHVKPPMPHSLGVSTSSSCPIVYSSKKVFSAAISRARTKGLMR